MKPLDINKQIAAATEIKSNLSVLGEAEDLQLLVDSIEGETEFFDVVDRLLDEIAGDQAMVEAIDAQIDGLKVRKERFAKRAEMTKALIEQAFVTCDLPKIERPRATLFLSKRAPKVVIETESDIPAKFWKPADPTLDKKALADELKEIRAGLDAVLMASLEDVDARADAFCQRFLDDEQAALFRAQVSDFFSENDEAREAARSTLKSRFGALPGASLTDATSTLSIRSA